MTSHASSDAGTHTASIGPILARGTARAGATPQEAGSVAMTRTTQFHIAPWARMCLNSNDPALSVFVARSPVRGVERDILGDLPLPAVAVGEQPLLVVIELFPCLGCELEV